MTGMRALLTLVGAWAVAVIWFIAFPGTDLAVSRVFFDGQGFPIQSNTAVQFLRNVLYAIETVAAVPLLGLALFTAGRGRAVWGLVARDWLYSFSVFLLGPGLAVNGIMKRVFGRARPAQVTEFGGAAQFTQPWQISDQCNSGCSFVSGEMAGAVAVTIVLALILRANRGVLDARIYSLGLGFAIAVPLVTAWQRIAAGRHFLSDVVFAALVVWMVALLLARLFYPASAVDNKADSP